MVRSMYWYRCANNFYWLMSGTIILPTYVYNISTSPELKPLSFWRKPTEINWFDCCQKSHPTRKIDILTGWCIPIKCISFYWYILPLQVLDVFQHCWKQSVLPMHGYWSPSCSKIGTYLLRMGHIVQSDIHTARACKTTPMFLKSIHGQVFKSSKASQTMGCGLCDETIVGGNSKALWSMSTFWTVSYSFQCLPSIRVCSLFWQWTFHWPHMVISFRCITYYGFSNRFFAATLLDSNGATYGQSVEAIWLAFLDAWCTMYTGPDRLCTDHGSVFTSDRWENIADMAGI